MRKNKLFVMNMGMCESSPYKRTVNVKQKRANNHQLQTR